MKKIFTLEELLVDRWCYTEEQIKELYSAYNRDITIVDILENKDISLYNKRWVLYNTCELTIEQQIELVCILGRAIVPIFNKKYPKDNRVNECWQAIDNFKNKIISKEQFLEKRKALDDIFYDINGSAGYAANAVFYAVSVIYYNIINVKNVSYCAYNAVSYVIDVAIENKDPIYSQLLNQLMIDFVNKN